MRYKIYICYLLEMLSYEILAKNIASGIVIDTIRWFGNLLIVQFIAFRERVVSPSCQVVKTHCCYDDVHVVVQLMKKGN